MASYGMHSLFCFKRCQKVKMTSGALLVLTADKWVSVKTSLFGSWFWCEGATVSDIFNTNIIDSFFSFKCWSLIRCDRLKRKLTLESERKRSSGRWKCSGSLTKGGGLSECLCFIWIKLEAFLAHIELFHCFQGSKCISFQMFYD